MAKLHSWTLNAPIDAMTLFRIHTVGDFPFVEAFLPESINQLTLCFSGNLDHSDYALTFTLTPTQTKVEPLAPTLLIGEYLAEDEEMSEIQIMVPIDPASKTMKGSEFDGKKKIQDFVVTRYDLGQNWVNIATED